MRPLDPTIAVFGAKPPWPRPDDTAAPLVVRRHRLTLAVALAIRALVVVANLVVGDLAGLMNALALLVILAAAILWATATWAHWYTDSFTLSPGTITFRQGLIARSRHVIALQTVQDVTTQQSIFGWLVGYGTLDFRLLSGAQERFTAAPDPQTVCDRVLSARLGVGGA
jgi:uncharacterized membrane protein YdbT with pleckstrin-like domain